MLFSECDSKQEPSVCGDTVFYIFTATTVVACLLARKVVGFWAGKGGGCATTASSAMFFVMRRQRKRCVFTATGVRLAVGTGATVSRSGGATHAGIEMWYLEESENDVGETSMVFELYRCNCVRIAPPCRSLIREGG